jgi:hypothetical protein
MRLFSRLSLLSVVALAAVVATAPVPASAEDVYRVIVPAQALNSATTNGPTLAVALGSLTVVVGETTCGTLDLTDESNRLPNGDKYIDIGVTPLQPGLCRAEGSRVRFFDGSGRKLFFETTLHIGTSVTVTNLAPGPPGAADEGLILGTLSVQGRGLVKGRSTTFDNLLVVAIAPADSRQPLQPILEWAAVVNESGVFAKVVEPGDYWIIPLNLVLTNANATVRVQRGGADQAVGVFKVSVRPGGRVRADLVVTAESYDNPPTPIPVSPSSEGREGQPGPIRPPITGDGGLVWPPGRP